MQIQKNEIRVIEMLLKNNSFTDFFCISTYHSSQSQFTLVSLIYTHTPLRLLFLPVSGCATIPNVPRVGLKYLVLCLGETQNV